MAFNFPDAPTLGLVFGNYTWDGEKWLAGGGSSSGGVLPTSIREKLTAPRTYYVRTDGSDANTGLANTSGAAFKTIQKAINVTYTLDLNGFGVTVQVADGAYTAGVVASVPFLGGSVSVLGNTTTPANVTVTLASGNVFQVTGGAQMTVKGFKVSNSVAGAGLYASSGGFITADRMDFGQVAGDHVEAADEGSISLFNGSYTISGGGSGHWHAHSGKIVDAYNTITLIGTPTFANYFCGIAAGEIQCQQNTFVGTANGPKFLIHYLGFALASAGNLNYLPGSSPGTLIDGGQYDQRFNGGTHEIVIIDNPTGFNTNNPTLQFQKAAVVSADIYDDGTNTVIANAAHTAGVYITHGNSSWNAISDRRLKAKANARDVSVLDKLDAVRLVEYGDGHREIGVIAQEFVEAFPHLVNVGDDEAREISAPAEPGAWSMMYDRAGVIALQGLKEAAAQIAELRAELDRLKTGDARL